MKKTNISIKLDAEMFKNISKMMIFHAIIVTIAFSSCSKKGADQKGKPAPAPVPVVTATVAEKDVPVMIRAVGSVEAYTTVSVKSQVGGAIQKIHFSDGQDVKKGDLLITIDPRPFQAALSQAKAVLAKDSAQLENARLIADHDEQLLASNLVSQEEYNRSRTNAKALAATVQADKAAVRNASLQLSYCYIRAPITGRAGSVLIHEGNLVSSNNAQAIVVLNQLKPIYVNFSVPAQYINEIRERMAADKLVVEAGESGGDAPIETGALTFIDNAVDESTGTIRLKATFDNTNDKLWPGTFVNVMLKLSTMSHVVVVPTQAIVTGQSGSYVFVVKEDSSVEMRAVAIKYELNGDSVVETGLNVGETVVTDGQFRILPGSKVAPKNSSEGK